MDVFDAIGSLRPHARGVARDVNRVLDYNSGTVATTVELMKEPIVAARGRVRHVLSYSRS